MKNVTLGARLWRDREGATLLEFTFVFPLLMLTALCTVDFALLMLGWAQANKTVQQGARYAVVSGPVAGGLDDLDWTENLGAWCIDPVTGNASGECPTVETVCIADATDGTCTHPDYDFDNDAFEAILEQMRTVALTLDLQRENVQITYRTVGLGFVGRPGGLPMEVTVELRCMAHEVFFLAAFASWAADWSGTGCPAGTSGVPIPSFATTLTTESLGS